MAFAWDCELALPLRPIRGILFGVAIVQALVLERKSLRHTSTKSVARKYSSRVLPYMPAYLHERSFKWQILASTSSSLEAGRKHNNCFNNALWDPTLRGRNRRLILRKVSSPFAIPPSFALQSLPLGPVVEQLLKLCTELLDLVRLVLELELDVAVPGCRCAASYPSHPSNPFAAPRRRTNLVWRSTRCVSRPSYQRLVDLRVRAIRSSCLLLILRSSYPSGRLHPSLHHLLVGLLLVLELSDLLLRRGTIILKGCHG